MSDRYLCRAKRIYNGEWIEGYYIRTEQGDYIVSDGIVCGDNTFLIEPYEYAEIHSATICQCTGLTDKNGNKIWEGDILSAHLDDEYPDDVTYVEIKWNGFSWCTRESTEDDVMTEYDCNTFEVCGNVFDNPELLEGGAE